MRQLKYNTASQTIPFELPAEWDGDKISALTLEVKDDAGVVLAAAAAVPIETANAIDGDVDRYSREITILNTVTLTVLSPGMSIEIVGAFGREIAIVKGHVVATKVIELESPLENELSDGDAVYFRNVTSTLDTSNIDTFTAGKVVTLLWAPTGTGHQTRELAQISSSVVDIEGIRRRFKRVYPRAFQAFTVPTDRMADMVEEAEIEVSADMLIDRMDYHRIVDQQLVSSVIMAKMAQLWALNGDEDLEDERKVLDSNYSKWYSRIAALPIWTDTNQDDKKDDGEVTSHEPYFEKAW